MLTLKAARVASDLTQKDMAEQLGVSHSSVSLKEKDITHASLDFIKRWYELCSESGKAVIRDYLKRNFF